MAQASGKAEQADTSASLPDGQQLAHVTEVNNLGREVWIDVVQYFEGQVAVDAACEDSKGTADIGDTEYYVRNANRRIRHFKVAADAVITLAELEAQAPDHERWLFWVTVEKGKVRSMYLFSE
jgi:hypothetical protein